jgi:hypothetical protein
MPYGLGKMTRLRLGCLRYAASAEGVGCRRNIPLGRGLMGTALSLAAGLALNDLTNPDGLIRSSVKKLAIRKKMTPLIGRIKGEIIEREEVKKK